jgi:ankyrin repeat protein
MDLNEQLFKTRCGDKNEITRLVKLGASVNAKSKYGYTLLHIECIGGNEEGISFLLDLGANINLVDEDNMSPLKLVMFSDVIKDNEKRLRLISFLQSRGAHFDVPNSNM